VRTLNGNQPSLEENNMSKKALVPVADGTEEIEAVTLIDVLRRAGVEVTVASVNNLQITASRGVRLVADCLIGTCRDRIFDLVVLPGGMPGAANLRDSTILKDILIRHEARGGLYGAICAAPAVVLEPYGLLQGKQATSHPSFAERLQDPSRVQSPVVVDGHCVTSQGPGTAMAFALQLVELLMGKARRDEVAAPMLI
jgi:4-methyl-5(b-hydroxyethyl)-thiazole monophosphate biosynthesis